MTFSKVFQYIYINISTCIYVKSYIIFYKLNEINKNVERVPQ